MGFTYKPIGFMNISNVLDVVLNGQLRDRRRKMVSSDIAVFDIVTALQSIDKTLLVIAKLIKEKKRNDS